MGWCARGIAGGRFSGMSRAVIVDVVVIVVVDDDVVVVGDRLMAV